MRDVTLTEEMAHALMTEFGAVEGGFGYLRAQCGEAGYWDGAGRLLTLVFNTYPVIFMAYELDPQMQHAVAMRLLQEACWAFEEQYADRTHSVTIHTRPDETLRIVVMQKDVPMDDVLMDATSEFSMMLANHPVIRALPTDVFSLPRCDDKSRDFFVLEAE